MMDHDPGLPSVAILAQAILAQAHTFVCYGCAVAPCVSPRSRPHVADAISDFDNSRRLLVAPSSTFSPMPSSSRTSAPSPPAGSALYSFAPPPAGGAILIFVSVAIFVANFGTFAACCWRTHLRSPRQRPHVRLRPAASWWRHPQRCLRPV